MSEYWKSNAKKFCEICKTWYADNKISSENHERGLKHKAMVQQRIRESGQKAREKDRKENDLRHTLICMEQAALVSMQKDLNSEKERQRNSRQAASSSAPQVKGVDPREEIRAQKRKLAELKKTSKRSQFWDPDAPDSTHEQNFDDVHNQVQNFMDSSLQTREAHWVQSETENGQTYYWNIYSGDTRWEVPEEPFYTAQQYSQRYNEIALGVAGSSLNNAIPQGYESAGMEMKSSSRAADSPLHALDIAPKPKRKSRFDQPPSSTSFIYNEVRSNVKVEVKPEPPLDLLEIKHESFQQSPTEEHLVKDTGPSANYPLGQWVRVEKPKPKPKAQVDDLLEEERKQKSSKNPSEIAEELSLEPSELFFGEKVLPVNDSSSKKKQVESGVQETDLCKQEHALLSRLSGRSSLQKNVINPCKKQRSENVATSQKQEIFLSDVSKKPLNEPLEGTEAFSSKLTTLSNGLRVASEPIFGEYCTVGVVIDAGSRYEANYPQGICHFLEKFAFSRQMDTEQIGAMMECQSSKDVIFYASSCHKNVASQVIKNISDEVFRPVITEDTVSFEG
uniref:WW domain-binding protein 4 n=1 Tax=Ditylenchus dipsaci TaxID=166011 RepID=A0A915ETJ1_9BILA